MEPRVEYILRNISSDYYDELSAKYCSKYSNTSGNLKTNKYHLTFYLTIALRLFLDTDILTCSCIYQNLYCSINTRLLVFYPNVFVRNNREVIFFLKEKYVLEGVDLNRLSRDRVKHQIVNPSDLIQYTSLAHSQHKSTEG